MIYWKEEEVEFVESSRDSWEPHYIYATRRVRRKYRWLEMDKPTSVKVPIWGNKIETVSALEWDDGGQHQHLVLESGIKLHLSDVEFIK